MGIQGLLKLLAHTAEPVNLTKLAPGFILGIDISSWLHKLGNVGSKTDESICKIIGAWLLKLLKAKVVPYVVFDGAPTAGKSKTAAKRAKTRAEAGTFQRTDALRSKIIFTVLLPTWWLCTRLINN